VNLDPVAILTGLLSEYSPSTRESGAVDYLVRTMSAQGYTAQVDGAGNAVGSRGDPGTSTQGRRGPNEIILLGHIDTVLGLIAVEREGDTLYGRGSVDAKGPLACFSVAAAAARLQPGWRLTVVGAVGEEGNSPGACFVRDTYPRPAMVIIGEPSGWDHITLGYKGSLWLKYHLTQPLAHTAARTTGACEQAVGFWNRLQAVTAERNAAQPKIFDQLTPALRGMESSNDGFHENARLAINLRLPPGVDCETLGPQLVALAEPARLEVEDCTPAYRGEKNSPLVRAFLAAIRQEGGQPGFTLKTGTSDMNIVGPAWGCPVVAYGPGDSNLDHTPREHILVSEYLKGIATLTRALELAMGST
jgi:LysW-gamma-L-lysine carboxypeptidase